MLWTLQDNAAIEATSTQNNDEESIVRDTSRTTCTECSVDAGANSMDADALINETVREMLQNFEEEMQDKWLELVMHGFDD